MAQKVYSFETDFLRYSFDSAGQVVEFTDKATGVNYATQQLPAFACYAGKGSRSASGVLGTDEVPEMPQEVSVCGQTVTVRFAKATFTLFAQCFADNIRVTVMSVAPANADFGRMLFMGCALKDGGMSPDFSGCMVTRHLKARLLEIPGSCEKLGLVAYSKLGVQGVAGAMIGIAPASLRTAAQNALGDASIDDVLINPYGGPWGADAPGARGDYMIQVAPIDFSTDEWIEALKRKGITQLDFHQGLEYRHGDYVFNEERYPGGVEDFKAKVSDKLHANGMLAGLHTYVAMVDVHSRYVTPVPHPDLYALAEYTLAEDLTEEADVVRIVEDTAGVEMVQHRHTHRYGRTLMIDQELIEFEAKEDGALTMCERGVLGTKISAHKKGAKVRHLRNMFGYYQSKPGSTLFYELAHNMADTYNRGDFDMMYFDGMECVGTCCTGELEGLGWYYEPLFVREVLKLLKRPSLVEYSTFYGQMWAGRSRVGAWDSASKSFTAFIRKHLETNEADGHRRMLPCTLGWWDIYPPTKMGKPERSIDASRSVRGTRPNWSYKAEFTDDIDYLGSKSVAFNDGVSYLSTPASTVIDAEKLDYPQYARLFERIAGYARLRQSNYFTQAVRDRIADLNTNFRLIRKDDQYGFVAQKRLMGRAFSFKDGENAVTVTNPYDTQQPALRLLAQCGAQPADAVVVAQYDREKPLSEQALVVEFPKTLDLTGHEALGVWVRGTGKDEVLNIRLEGQPPKSTGFGDHIVNLNYEGWRFVMLCEDDNGEFEILPRGGVQNDIEEAVYLVYREIMNYCAVKKLHIKGNADLSQVYIGDVCAYPVDDTPVVRPSVTAGGNTVVFDTALAPGSYIEYTPGAAQAVMYDIYGHTQSVAVEGDAPVLDAGDNQVFFGGEAEGSHRMKLHMIVDGEEIFN